MAYTIGWYGKGILAAFNKEVKWTTDTIKLALTGSSYTADRDADDYFDDISDEVTGSGYTAGGKELTNCTLTYESASSLLVFSSDAVLWDGITVTAHYGVIYNATLTSASLQPLLLHIDFGGSQACTSGCFSVTPAPTLGWASISAS